DEERDAVNEALGPNSLPNIHVDPKSDAQSRLDRVKTDLDITTLRLEIVSTGNSISTAPASVATAPAAANTPAAHLRRARQEFAANHLDQAETEYRAALASDPSNAVAHRGLAEIARRRGKLDDAVAELQASLKSRDSAVVRTMLAKVYLEQKKF